MKAEEEEEREEEQEEEAEQEMPGRRKRHYGADVRLSSA